MDRSCGYVLERRFVGDILDEYPQISESLIQQAGGGIVALVLYVRSVQRMRLYRLAKELKFHSRYSAAQAVAVSMPTRQGRVWEGIPLSSLLSIADEAVALKDQRRLEAALRPRV